MEQCKSNRKILTGRGRLALVVPHHEYLGEARGAHELPHEREKALNTVIRKYDRRETRRLGCRDRKEKRVHRAVLKKKYRFSLRNT